MWGAARRVSLRWVRRARWAWLAAAVLAGCGGDGGPRAPWPPAGTVQIEVLDEAGLPADAHGVALRVADGPWTVLRSVAPGRYAAGVPDGAGGVEVAVRCDGREAASRLIVHAFALDEGRRLVVSYCRAVAHETWKVRLRARLPAAAVRLAAAGSGAPAGVFGVFPPGGRAELELPTTDRSGTVQTLALLASDAHGTPQALAVERAVDVLDRASGVELDLSDPGPGLRAGVPLDVSWSPAGWRAAYRLHLLTASGAKLVLQEGVGALHASLVVPVPAAGGAADSDWLELYVEAAADDGRSVYSRLHRRVTAPPAGFHMDLPLPFWPSGYRPVFSSGLVFPGLVDNAPGHAGYRFRAMRAGDAREWELDVSDGYLSAAGRTAYGPPALEHVPGFGDFWWPAPGERVVFDVFSGGFEGVDWQGYILAPPPIGNFRHLPREGQRVRVSRIRGAFVAGR